MAIRTRILIVVVALVFVALTVLDIVSYTVVRHSLISNADTELQAAAPTFLHSLHDLLNTGEPGALCGGLPLNSFGAIYTTTGTPTHVVDSCPLVSGVKLPKLPSSFLSTVDSSTDPVSTTISSYRVMVQQATLTGQGPPTPIIFVVGEPIAPVNSTLGTVLLLELLVTGSILVAVGATAFFLVQLGLRPLEAMAGTAGEIAAGDLSRRVEDADERTEVGRLGSSLNVMLSRIEQAFRAKEASEEQLRRFVADASHELRTPLTSIRGYAELFRDGGVARPEDLAAALRRIDSESSRMSGLVEDLLLLARLDQGRPFDMSPVDLVTVVEDVVRDSLVVAPDREISVRMSPGDLVALGDEERLHQVIANLVSNALAHTPERSPVEVVGNQAGSYVRLQVIDHGPGIPEEERSKVFDRFWRADESRQRTKGGNGLGLSIVAAVVFAHGGRVFVEDTPGGGATFVVDLPAAAAAEGGTDDGAGAGLGADADADAAAHRAWGAAIPVAPLLPEELVQVPTTRPE
ncbi:MAG: sensor histidine kinase [Acidimicrobiales bacterium]